MTDGAVAFPDSPTGVAVFGSSEPQAGEPLYDLARQLGPFLAAAGCPVVAEKGLVHVVLLLWGDVD